MRAFLFASLLLAPGAALAQEPLVLEDEVPADAPRYFEVPFDVPEGVVELEVRHDDLSEANILDFGLRDPEGVRGWGGGNREPIVINADAASRSYRPGPIREGRWAVLVGQALVVEAPARYRIEIELRTEPTLAPQQERAPYAPSPALASGPAWYAGDFHVHSRESGDARPSLDQIASFARERGLDFVVLTDHNVVSQVDFIVDAQARHPELLFVPGIEITTYWGHANAIGATEWVDFRVMSNSGASIETLLDAVSAQGAAFSINHPVLDLGNQCIGCAWNLEAPPEQIQALELQNGAYSITGTLFYRRAVQFWEALLDRGGRVAAIGGSDDHGAGEGMGAFTSPIGSPTTMVHAEALSASAIVQAVREGRTVVKLEGPDDPMVELFAGDARIGDTVRAPSVELRAVVTGGEGATLRFLRNGSAYGDSIVVDADPFEATLTVAAPGGEVDDRWRAELRIDGSPRVVTSHIWVAATSEPLVDGGVDSSPMSEGCGCRAAGAARSLPPALLFAVLGLFFVRRLGGPRRDRAVASFRE